MEIEKPILIGIADVQEMFGVGRNKALTIMRSIKQVSDIAHIKGKCTLSDYTAWYKRTGGKKI